MMVLEDLLTQVEAGTLDVLSMMTAAAELDQSGQPAGAETLYKAWIEQNPEHHLLHAANFNFATLLESQGRLTDAAALLREAIRLDPDFPPAYINLGNCLAQTGDRVGAAGTWNMLVNNLANISPDSLRYKMTALKLLGRLFADSDLDGDAEDMLFRIIGLDAKQRDILGYWVNTRQRQCKWPVLWPLPETDRRAALEAMAPLSLLSCEDDPLWHLAKAAFYTQELAGKPAHPLPPRPAEGSADRRLRIGYLSSDLCDHAVGYLTVEIFALHDRTEVEVFAYYNGTKHEGELQQRIKSGFDHWRDIAGLEDDTVARTIADDGIDILIDLNGHTKDARLGTLAHAPAPIIVNWLGYPGSMGSPFHHYIIADETIIPPDAELYYSEKVLRLPCYQPIDRHRKITEQHPTRAEMGLPDDAMVYCSFNDPRKISQRTWNAWMEILAAVPGSVLWLLIPAHTTRAQLKAMAQGANIDPARLIFAERRVNQEHLIRYRLADLVLDCFPYGAHTTASDALWMGVPVLTIMGRSFPSRVCGSLVRAAGLSQLVCDTWPDYIAKAIELGRNAEALDDLCGELRDKRDHCLLFDTPRLVRSLEALYRQMWQEFLAGKRPRPDLSNIAVYHDIAMDLALSGEEDPNYPAAYRRAFETRQTYTFLHPDPRLWPSQ